MNPCLFRPTEIALSRGNLSKSKRILGWQVIYTLKEVITAAVNDELQGAALAWKPTSYPMLPD
jgi:GDP-D-mannose dehydratase